MGISRIQKYKEYRNSLIKEGSPVLDTENDNKLEINNSNFQTTSTLPLDQVIKAMEEDTKSDDVIKKVQKRRIIQYSILGLCVTLLIVGIVIFGILVFR